MNSHLPQIIRIRIRKWKNQNTTSTNNNSISSFHTRALTGFSSFSSCESLLCDRPKGRKKFEDDEELRLVVVLLCELSVRLTSEMRWQRNERKQNTRIGRKIKNLKLTL
jgi:hypothetical protein